MDQHLPSAGKTFKATALEPERARYSIPLGTRSIGYFTWLLKPQPDEQKFEESFTTWQFQLPKYEQDNNTLLPDAVKTTTATPTAASRKHHKICTDQIHGDRILQSNGSNNQGPAPMDIGAAWRNKGKGKKGEHKGKGKRNKGNVYRTRSYGNNYSCNNYKGGKGKYSQQPVGQGNPFKSQQEYGALHSTCFFHIYNLYTCELGFLHTYNAVIKVDDISTARDHDTIFAGLAQALLALSHMSAQRSTAVITKMSKCGADYKIATTPVKPLEQLSGRKTNECWKGLHKTDTPTTDMEEDKKRKRTE